MKKLSVKEVEGIEKIVELVSHHPTRSSLRNNLTRLLKYSQAQAREEREESVKHQAVLLFQRSSETLMGDYRRGYEKAISDLLASAEGDK